MRWWRRHQWQRWSGGGGNGDVGGVGGGGGGGGGGINKGGINLQLKLKFLTTLTRLLMQKMY